MEYEKQKAHTHLYPQVVELMDQLLLLHYLLASKQQIDSYFQAIARFFLVNKSHYLYKQELLPHRKYVYNHKWNFLYHG